MAQRPAVVTMTAETPLAYFGTDPNPVPNTTVARPDEICTALDVSRNGILFVIRNQTFYRGREVAVTFPYTECTAVLRPNNWEALFEFLRLQKGKLPS